jgi:hypothetical protein
LFCGFVRRSACCSSASISWIWRFLCFHQHRIEKMVQPTIQVPHPFVSTPNSGNPNEPPLSRSILQWTFALPDLNGIPTAILPFDRLMMGSRSGVHGTSLHIRTRGQMGNLVTEM